MKGFFHFIRQQGVVGLAIGFILGGTINGVVKSLVDDVIQPLIGMIFGSASLTSWTAGPVRLGNFFSMIINFIVIAAVVYFIFKGLKLDKLDLPKDMPGTKPVDPTNKTLSGTGPGGISVPGSGSGSNQKPAETTRDSWHT